MLKLNEYLTVGKAAKHLGVSRDTLRRWDRASKLTARRHSVTAYRMYLKKELDDLLNRADRAGKSAGRKRRKRAKR